MGVVALGGIAVFQLNFVLVNVFKPNIILSIVHSATPFTILEKFGRREDILSGRPWAFTVKTNQSTSSSEMKLERLLSIGLYKLNMAQWKYL